MQAERSIDRHRVIWQQKPALRAVYSDYHARIAAHCRPGRTLEVGGGGGHMREFVPDVVAMDIQQAPWLDVIADAHGLPFADGCFENITMLDVLHHLAEPAKFLREAERVLAPGGRLVMIEPAMTLVSWPALSLFHEEPVVLGNDPLQGRAIEGDRPEDANQAIPHLIFRRHNASFAAKFPRLHLVELRHLSLLAYPLSGGFKRWSLIPASWVRPLLRIEDLLMPVLGRLAAFRLLIVLERAA